MKKIGLVVIGVLAVALVSSALVTPASPDDNGFTLHRAVPNDVFLCISERSDPERKFIEQYWEEVMEALSQSGIGQDVIDMITSLIGMGDADLTAEMERLREKAFQLVEGVDWLQLGCKETVFTERFLPPEMIPEDKPPIFMPSMALLFRGSGEGALKNYKGLAAILQTLADEVNNAAGMNVLALDATTQNGAKVTRLGLGMQVREAPEMSVSVALRDDIIIIGIRKHVFNDVLALLDGSSRKGSLADDPRYQAVFAKLPTPENSMVFFDMQALLNPITAGLKKIFNTKMGPPDRYENSGMKAEINGTNAEAMSAYRKGNIEKALSLTRKAHGIDPENSIILYNLACFNACTGNRDEALDWLQKAVEGGFYAPRKIAGDSDLADLHNEPEYKAALERAYELALEHSAKDVAVNCATEGDVLRLRMQIKQAYEVNDYEQAMRLAKQAFAIAPDDSQVLYIMGCLHTLLGHESEGLDFLEQAVDGGFYCPKHMSKDPDWDSVRHHDHFKAALAKAQDMAIKTAARESIGEIALVKRIINRLADAAGVLDYTAEVETTTGYTTTTESIAVLVPDADKLPIYKLFGKRRQMTGFDKYLPKETKSFSVSGGIDLEELYSFIEGTVLLAGGKGEEILAKWNSIQKQIGLDIREDVINWIDGDSVSVTLEDGGGSVMMFKVTDEETAREKIAAGIEFLSTKLTEIVRQKPEFAGLAMLGVRSSPATHEELEGFQNLYFSMSPQPIVWGVADGHLIFSESADAIALCLATARGEHSNIRENSLAMSEAVLPEGPFCNVSLTDQRKLGEEMAAGIGIASMVTTMMGSFIPEPKVRPLLTKIAGILGKLVPVVSKIDFYKSTARCTTFDGTAWRTRAVTHYFSPQERATKDM